MNRPEKVMAGAGIRLALLLVVLSIASDVQADQGTLGSCSYSSILLRDDGAVLTWGNNSSGQLGVGHEIQSSSPMHVSFAGNEAIWIAGGDNHMLAVRADGTVWAWGLNTYGALGDGSTTSRLAPVPTGGGLAGAVAASGGTAHSLALTSDGKVHAWGRNDHGQLGNGNQVTQLLPIEVTGLADVAMIGAGASHSLALDGNGEVWAWGSNQYGQLGNGSGPGSMVPAKISGLGNVVSIATRGDHSLALDEDGTVWAWGRNASGQLGGGNLAGSSIPVAVGVENVIRISAGWHRSMALDTDGNVWCWGANSFESFGPNTSSLSPAPMQVPGLGGAAVEISAGSTHSLVLLENGLVVAWGNNGFGQLGFGLNRSRFLPEQTLGLRNVVGFDMGEGFGVAVKADGSVWTWGNNSTGQLGEPASLYRSYPAPLVGMNEVKACSAGAKHAASVDLHGNVWTWGANERGQLGNNTYTDSSVPSQVVGLSPAKAMAAGSDFTLALLQDGTVEAWGGNEFGQLGDGTGIDSPVALEVEGLSGVKQICAGWGHALALKEDGTVWAWGDNSAGQLGTGFPEESGLFPVLVAGLQDIVSVAAGAYHSIAVRGDGTVFTWGDNSSGQLGRSGVASDTPVAIPSLGGIKKAGAGDFHTFAISNDSQVYGWGANYDRQLGDGSTLNRFSPVHLTALAGAADICGGPTSSVALKVDGTMLSWGSSDHGELGDGYLPIANPTLVPGVNRAAAVPSVTLDDIDGMEVPLGSSFLIGAPVTQGEIPLDRVTFNSRGIFLAEDETAPFSWEFTPDTWGDFEINAIAVDAAGTHSLASGAILKVPYDHDADLLPDHWELRYLKGTDVGGEDDHDGDGFSNEAEYQADSDPTDYYNGDLPVISTISGEGAYAEPGKSSVLVKEVRRGGIPLADAPVWFERMYPHFSSVGEFSLTDQEGSFSERLTARTGPDGRVRVYVRRGATTAPLYVNTCAGSEVGLRAGSNNNLFTVLRYTYPQGTLGFDATGAIDIRIAMKSAPASSPIFSVQDHATSTYVRNPGCWAYDLAEQMSCISPWNSREGSLRAGVAVSRRHVLNAAHFPLAVGDAIRFVTADNAVVNRTIVGRAIHPAYAPGLPYPDLAIYTLDQDLPSSIVPCKVLPPGYEAYLGPLVERQWNPPALCLDQEEKALVKDFAYFTTVAGLRRSANFGVSPLAAHRVTFNESLVTGDSGNPAFLILRDKLVLLTVWAFGGAGGSGTFTTSYLTDLNTMIQTADSQAGISTGLQIQTIDLGGYIPFSP